MALIGKRWPERAPQRSEEAPGLSWFNPKITLVIPAAHRVIDAHTVLQWAEPLVVRFGEDFGWGWDSPERPLILRLSMVGALIFLGICLQ